MGFHVSDMRKPDGSERPDFSIKPLTLELSKLEFPAIKPPKLPTELPSPSKGFGQEFAVTFEHPSKALKMSITYRAVPMPENARRVVERIQECRDEIRALEEQAKRLGIT